MSHVMRAVFVDDFVGWARRCHPDVEVSRDVAETIVDYKHLTLGSPNPRCWTRGDLTTLMVDVMPYTTPPHGVWVRAVCDTVTLFADYLERVTGARYGYFQSEAMMAVEAFTSAMDRPGVGRSLRPRALAEARASVGHPLFDDASPVAFPLAALPPEWVERVPPTTLASVADLAAATAGSTLVTDVVALSTWLSEQGAVLRGGQPAPGTAERAIAQLGWLDHASFDTALRRFHECWGLAVVTGFIDRSSLTTFPGTRFDQWVSGSDAATLTVWSHVMDMIPGQLVLTCQVPVSYRSSTVRGLTAMLGWIYLGGVPVSELSPSDNDVGAREVFERSLDVLARHGAIAIDDTVMRLTPLGVWWMAGRFRAWGWDVPWSWAVPSDGRTGEPFDGGLPWPAAVTRPYPGYQTELRQLTTESTTWSRSTT